MKKSVTLRAIASALEKSLQAADNNVSWVQVTNETSFTKEALRCWSFDDDMIEVSVADGDNEGKKIRVYAFNRLSTLHLVALFEIKLFASINGAFDTAKTVFAFFESPEFAALFPTPSREVSIQVTA